LPTTLIRSITWDQGIEMARHTDITADTGVMVSFCGSPPTLAATRTLTVCCDSTSQQAPA
jgi:hypothetical protein